VADATGAISSSWLDWILELGERKADIEIAGVLEDRSANVCTGRAYPSLRELEEAVDVIVILLECSTVKIIVELSSKGDGTGPNSDSGSTCSLNDLDGWTVAVVLR
jgi:hypothetical protein